MRNNDRDYTLFSVLIWLLRRLDERKQIEALVSGQAVGSDTH